MYKTFQPVYFVFILFSIIALEVSGQSAPLWSKHEITIINKNRYANPFTDTELIAEFTGPDKSVKRVFGFYDGGNRWKIRLMPDQVGVWRYKAWFSGKAKVKFSGRLRCVAGDIPGMIVADETNPAWFGLKGGKHFLMRSLHVGDRFFAANWPDSARKRFLNWAAENKYNTLSIASHYLNRNQTDRGKGWQTPDLWDTLRRQPNPAAYAQMEAILDDLAKRKIIVFPFGGFFGQGGNYPRDTVNQRLYVKYTLSRLSVYWNLLFNVAGPEPLLPRLQQFTKEQIDHFGNLIASMNVNKHLLTVHNVPHRNPFLSSSWATYHCLQGASLNTDTLYHNIMRGRNVTQPVIAHEMLWYGNMYQANGSYTDDQLRRNAYVINMAAAALNFGDNNGNSSTGFTGSLNLNERHQDKHEIVKGVWDFFESIPFYDLEPSNQVSDQGYTLFKAGSIYLTYLPKGGTVTVDTKNTGNYVGQWIDGRNTAIRINTGLTDGRNLKAPSNEDWLLYLRKNK